MQVASIQMSVVEGDKEATIGKATKAIAQCREADVVILPEIFLVCSAWPYPRLEHWLILNRVRAIENQCFESNYGSRVTEFPFALADGRNCARLKIKDMTRRAWSVMNKEIESNGEFRS